MSEKYDEYIKEHKENVFKGFQWLEENLPELFPNEEFKAECRHQCEFSHDQSKYELDEYDAYDAYFYGGNRSFKVVSDFDRAWLLHIHRNPHHWQYWILVKDDPDEDEIILDMPDNYIIEMICDWWSFSWKKGDLTEIFNWYDGHQDHIKLSNNTCKKVVNILFKIHKKLSESDVDEEN